MKAFVDTCVVRYSQNCIKTWEKVLDRVPTFDGWKVSEILRYVERKPLEALNSPEHARTYKEASACAAIEDLAKDEIVFLVWGLETSLETVLNSTLGDPRPSIISLLHIAESPIRYSRPLSPEALLPFFRGISNPEFEKWKKALGVVRDSKRERNQMMDAWHLWTAEHNNCDCFITADQKMIDSILSRKVSTKMLVLSPSGFLSHIGRTGAGCKKSTSSLCRRVFETPTC